MKTLYVKSSTMVGARVVDEGPRLSRYQMSMSMSMKRDIVPFANLYDLLVLGTRDKGFGSMCLLYVLKSER